MASWSDPQAEPSSYQSQVMREIVVARLLIHTIQRSPHFIRALFPPHCPKWDFPNTVLIFLVNGLLALLGNKYSWIGQLEVDGSQGHNFYQWHFLLIPGKEMSHLPSLFCGWENWGSKGQNNQPKAVDYFSSLFVRPTHQSYHFSWNVLSPWVCLANACFSPCLNHSFSTSTLLTFGATQFFVVGWGGRTILCMIGF